MFKFIESIVRRFEPGSPIATYTVTVNTSLSEMIDQYTITAVTEEIISGLAKKYIEDFGPEILKRIQDQTIESKVIQKIVSSLRAELKKGRNDEDLAKVKK